MGALPYAIGPYRIVRLLGEGGMGAVYEARQEPLDRRVALKTLHPEYARNQEAVARFFNEAKVLSKLEHPSIVQVSDFDHTSDGIAYLVMEYLRGESLAQRLAGLAERRERLPPVAALQFAWQVADVLAVAHAQGIVHREWLTASGKGVAGQSSEWSSGRGPPTGATPKRTKTSFYWLLVWMVARAGASAKASAPRQRPRAT